MTKTTNYNLNQWGAADRVTWADFNADDAAVDAALKTIATAAAATVNCAIYHTSYIGEGNTDQHTITVPKGKPDLLIVSLTISSVYMIAMRGMSMPVLTSQPSQVLSYYTITWGDNYVAWRNSNSMAANFSNVQTQYEVLVLSE